MMMMMMRMTMKCDDHAQNTGIYSIFGSWYHMLPLDVEQDTLSPAVNHVVINPPPPTNPPGTQKRG